MPDQHPNTTGQPVLETERLLIRPLSYHQLCLYIRPDLALERDLGVKPHPRTVPDELTEALEQLILPGVAQAGDNYLFSTLWTIIDRHEQVMTGDLCFKGPPGEQGEIEVGYGTYPDFQNKGYMTEALGAVVNWAMHQPGVTAVLAETEKENLPSHRTLSKNGFTACREVDQMIWWRLDKAV
ncbi:MAG TPA: GNAT family N-acetyltransferase [Flavilitoribacter sp.]|nr:GNAT family N-acetyltransferase [Flavilitoribacter sp.]HMQ87611.1 GNAT family N-acetyltransferase [Flavilitoribacter sp.]